MWSYNGEFILRSIDGECYVRGSLKESIDWHMQGNGWVQTRVEGLHHWSGSARCQGAPRGLRDVLGEECELILPTGAVGRCYVTAYSQDSAWVIEIQGIGEPPS